MKELAKGKYVHANKLIRQHVSSSNPADRRETPLVHGLSIVSTSHRPKLRTVESSHDWFEVMFSSVLPAMVMLVQNSTSVEEAKSHATTLQQHVCYSLYAVHLFRQHSSSSFAQIFKYLETHRQVSINQSTNVAVPDLQTLQALHHSLMSFTSTHNNNNNNSSNNNRKQLSSSSTSMSSSSSSSLSTAPFASPSSGGSRYGGAKSKFPFEHCGKFNSREGCNYENCKRPHICRECKSDKHSKTTCPKFNTSKNFGAHVKPS